ncbi:Phosphate acetyltransferase [Buchnera aphidicola (Takecallis arundicolens)]|uniref:phosphate acetyltransferase n=1 Tax=Buchnera aphidicola TaxID=9 RepID=UPI003464E06C
MTRTIMLVPIGNSVGLTTVSVSLLKLVYENKLSAIFFKPFPDILNDIDDTANIVNRNFGIPSIKPVLPVNTMFLSDREYVKKLIQDNLDLYYSYYNKYDIIFIEGKKNSNLKYYIHDLNLKFLYHTRCELIIYNVNYNDFYKEFLFYKKKYDIRNRIIGIINNFYDISIKKYNDILFSPYSLINHHIHLNRKSVVVSNIPWNKKLIYFPIYAIFKLIKIENILKKYTINQIDSFVLYDQFFFNMSNHIFNSVLLIPFYKFIKKYQSLCVILECNILHSIILTDCNKYDICNFSILKKQFKYKILLFYTKSKFDQVILSIHMFHKNMIINDKIYLNSVILHFTNYINKKFIFRLLVHTRKQIIHFSQNVFQQYLIEKAKNKNSHILLPEGSEERIIHAASIVSNLGIVQCTLLGNKKIIHQIAKKNGWNINNNINIINPINIYKNYIEKLFVLRAHKGITWKLSEKYVQDHMVLGSLLLLENEVDGVVCGVKYTTAEVLRTAIQLIGIKKNIYSNSPIVSSSFFMLLKSSILLYSDCAVNIDPNIKQLVNIVLDTSDLAILFDIKPKIAMLSYSTGISGSGDTVEKVRKATCLVKKIRPDLTIDGPIQYDAAINPNISNIKLPKSCLHGQANVFIFPDLNSGNITYKAVQQSLNISSIGPILQGLMKPVNDLSRGATVNDIVYTILVTAIQKIT